jgi:hypothetical protein
MSGSASALGITHALATRHRTYLTPFAMWPAFPTSDYYGVSVAMGVSPSGDPTFRARLTFRTG